MATASHSLATALWRARFASGLLRPSYTTSLDTTHTPPVIDLCEQSIELCPLQHHAVVNPLKMCPLPSPRGPARKKSLCPHSGIGRFSMQG